MRTHKPDILLPPLVFPACDKSLHVPVLTKTGAVEEVPPSGEPQLEGGIK